MFLKSRQNLLKSRTSSSIVVISQIPTESIWFYRIMFKFHAKGGDLPHMSSPAVWTNLYEKCALEWWATWGVELPELQKFAVKVVPLLIGSGPAERTWKDVDSILTKKRNRFSMTNMLDMLHVRTWLWRELKKVSDSELECFKEWETELLRQSSFYDGEVEPDEGIQRHRRILRTTLKNGS